MRIFIDKNIVKHTLILGLALLLTGCFGSGMQDLEDFVANAYKDKKPEIEPLPAIRPYDRYEYSSEEKEDPFNAQNIIADRTSAAVAGISPDANRRKEELESYPLDALKFVGTLIRKKQPWVVIETNEGKAFRATIGNYMGQNDGKIKAIVPDEQKVVLAELVLDPAGRWVTREVELTIDE